MSSLSKLSIATVTKMVAVIALTGFISTIGSVSVNAGEHTMGTDWEKLNWVKRGPIEVVMLWGSSEGEESAFFLKIKAGKSPGKMHAHSEDYRGVTLQGTWLKTTANDSLKMYPAGSYLFQPKKEWHNDGCAGPENCILLIHFEGPRDVFFPN